MNDTDITIDIEHAQTMAKADADAITKAKAFLETEVFSMFRETARQDAYGGWTVSYRVRTGRISHRDPVILTPQVWPEQPATR